MRKIARTDETRYTQLQRERERERALASNTIAQPDKWICNRYTVSQKKGATFIFRTASVAMCVVVLQFLSSMLRENFLHQTGSALPALCCVNYSISF